MRILLAILLLDFPMLAAGQAVTSFPNVGSYTKVIERFYYNGKLNMDNLRYWYLDSEDRPVYWCFLDSGGKPRDWTFNRYDSSGLLIESQSYEIEGNHLKRWIHRRTETEKTDTEVIYRTFESYYEDAEELVETVTNDVYGKRVSSEYNGKDGSYSYVKFDVRGNMILEVLENEKSGGRHTYVYDNRYDGENLMMITISKDGNVTGFKENTFKDSLLITTREFDLMKNLVSRIDYEYNGDGKLIRTIYKDENGKSLYELYNIYDGGFLKENGEVAKDYRRYWTYEKAGA